MNRERKDALAGTGRERKPIKIVGRGAVERVECESV